MTRPKITLVFILLLSGLRLLRADPHLPPAPSEPTPIFPEDQIRPGMVGTTYTVLQGNEIVPVHTVVEGVQMNALGPGLNLIIAKLDDPQTQLVEAVHGMSGSPLYINGKLAGALSHGIASFIKDGQCGFTPIQDMLQVKTIMEAHEASPEPQSPPNLPSDLHLAADLPSEGMAPLAAPLSISGVSPDLFEKLLNHFNSIHPQWLVVPGGGGGDDAVVSDKSEPSSAEIRAGSPLAVVLMAGSIHIGGTGTCTWREGNKILAFGHPMLGLGNCQYPMAESTIISTIPSFEYPYKMSNLGQIVGTIEEDRVVAIAGELGPLPPMATYQVNLSHDGVAGTPLHGTFVTDPDQLPVLTGTALLGGLQDSLQAGRRTSVRVSGQLELANHTPIQISGFFSGTGSDPLLSLAIRALEPIAAVLARKEERVVPVKLLLNLDQSETESNWSIDTLQPDKPLYDAGATVQVQVRLKSDFGGYQTRTLTVPLPETVHNETVRIRLSSGGDLDAQTLGPAARDARSIDQLIEIYNARRQTDRLYAEVVRDTTGLIIQGHPMPDLPPSVREVMTGGSSTDQPDNYNEEVLSESSVAIPGQVSGLKDVFVQVR